MIVQLFRTMTIILVLVICFVFLPSQCSAALIGFERITSNGSENPESQLSVDISDSSGRVLFKFFNDSGALAAQIAQVYWHDTNGLLSNGPDVDLLNTSGGVDLSKIPASPSSLPGQNIASFITQLSAGKKSTETDSIGPGEFAGFLFTGDANAVISGIQNGSLRIGLHVISIGAGGDSEAFVNTPEPASLVLVCMGLLGLATRRKC